MKNNRPSYHIYTDGSCYPNPGGTGGWAFRVIEGEIMSQGFIGKPCTNNLAELMAIYKAIQWVPKNTDLTILTDSFVCICWLKKREPITPNPRATNILILLREQIKNKNVFLKWVQVKGHGYDKNNYIVDLAARYAREHPELLDK